MIVENTFIFNCSTNIVGGAVQNSVNFIKEIYRNEDQGKWFFILSEEVFMQVSGFICDDKCAVFKSPAKSFLSRFKIKRLVKKMKPELVYTSAGPTYIKFDSFHVMGCSNPYFLGPSKQAIDCLGGKLQVFIRTLHTIYQAYYFKMANHWFLQTEASMNELTRKLRVTQGSCSIIHNAVSNNFLAPNSDFKDISSKQVIKVFVPSAYYPHKNLEIIPTIITLLNNNSNKRYEFYLTISNESFENFKRIEGFEAIEAQIFNHGTYSHSDAARLYSMHDVVFLPSVLEVFSTSYIEAIAMKMPLIVPEFSFSKSICKSYPIYYESDSIESCVSAFSCVDQYYKRKSYFSNTAQDITSLYKTQSERYQTIINILTELNRLDRY